MKAAPAGKQFPGPEDLLAGIQGFLSEIQRSQLDPSFAIGQSGFNWYPDRPVTTTYRPFYTMKLIFSRQSIADVQLLGHHRKLIAKLNGICDSLLTLGKLRHMVRSKTIGIPRPVLTTE
jgi:hypothetical protein